MVVSESHSGRGWAIPDLALNQAEEQGGLPGGGGVANPRASQGPFRVECCISAPGRSHCPRPEAGLIIRKVQAGARIPLEVALLARSPRQEDDWPSNVITFQVGGQLVEVEF